jgi:starvation-inducible DNA-binding protein
MEELYNLLIDAQANLFCLFQKTWMYHWNVMGIDFYQLHTMFGGQYEDMFEEIDRLTEHMRYLKIKAMGPISKVAKLSEIPEAESVISAKEMVSQLMSDNEKLIDKFTTTALKADELKQIATANLLQDLIDRHGKFVWMLRSTIS